MSLKHGDLKGTILPSVTIDLFEPKAGKDEDVIVVAFYLNDENPANDLNTFIQRGSIDTLDVEVSPNTDDDGNYLVFVEMSRDDMFFDKFKALLKDVSNLSGKIDWEISTYFSNGQTFAADDPALNDFIITNPNNYVSKEDFKMKSVKEGVENFFRSSYLTDLTITDNTVIMSGLGKKIIAEVIDVGDYDVVIGRNFLAESAFNLRDRSVEAKVLESIIGNCQVLPIGGYLCVNKNDTVLLLKNTTLKY